MLATDKFVDFIQQEDRIANTDVFESLNDPTRHWTDVSPPMTTNIRLITDSTQCDSIIAKQIIMRLR